jgi:ribosomal protein S18 acetylase RimI-like enzyme
MATLVWQPLSRVLLLLASAPCLSGLAVRPQLVSAAASGSARRCGPPACVRDDMRACLGVELGAPLDDGARFLFGTAEPDDLPACVAVLMDGFYRDLVTIAADDGGFSSDELEKLLPLLRKLNGGLRTFTQTLLTLETQCRLSKTLASPPRRADGLPTLPTARGSEDALLFAVQDRKSGAIVAVVELSEQARDGKVPGDVRLPSPPWAEKPGEVAYLANLAVHSDYRGAGIGRSLVAACEAVVRRWGYDELYLHAATQKERLLRLYKDLEYEALPDYDQPAWVLRLSGREATRYHRKVLARGEKLGV